MAYRRLLRYVNKHGWLFGCMVIFALGVVVSKLTAVYQLAAFFSGVFLEKTMQNPFQSAFLLFLSASSWAISHYVMLVCSNTLAVKVLAALRQDVYEKVLMLPVGYFKSKRTGDIISRLTNDIQVVEVFLMNVLIELLVQPLTVIAIIIMMVVKQPLLTLYFFSVVPILGIVLGIVGNWVEHASRKVQGHIADVTSGIQETLYGIDVIKGFAVEEVMRDRFSRHNLGYLSSLLREVRIRFLSTPVAEWFGSLGIIIILVIGGLMVRQGQIASGDIVFFLLLATVLSEPLSLSSTVFTTLRKLSPALDRIYEVLDYEIPDESTLPSLTEVEGELVCENVSFGYEPGRLVLQNVSLTIRPRETVAIVGLSGSGKTTLVSLLAGFYTPTKGRVLIDGKELTNYSGKSYRHHMGIVTQEPILFSGTIRENIALSRPEVSFEEIVKAARIAHADVFIRKLPQGYDTLLGDKGAQLSGGERQRIALARAILRRPSVLILDEATSALDAESEQAIQDAMENILGQQTTIIIAHKLLTIMHADRIVVLHEGQVVEVGSHKELLKKGGIYARLFQMQMVD
ncbi:ABC transporter ATP-binding protein [Thermospira aquatica]|uniref:ABC transporter ATP-binding protein n=1 Tax=Thermospira aquatica TaxID=2828656 RepID=A0AAX3BB72_9SPIR|nr:ABC transporter ATP-binding protein [Thermospira aquatica]URA09547.1 ABC transporter ATP-binding protein [Thermospira aquatica]